jgi:hypothetical protein
MRLRRVVFMILILFLVSCAEDTTLLQSTSDTTIVQTEIIDNEAPHLFVNATYIDIFEGESFDFENLYIAAYDDVDGDLSNKVRISNTDTSKLLFGVHKIVFKVSDYSGNTATYTLTVNVSKVHLTLTEVYTKFSKNISTLSDVYKADDKILVLSWTISENDWPPELGYTGILSYLLIYDTVSGKINTIDLNTEFEDVDYSSVVAIGDYYYVTGNLSIPEQEINTSIILKINHENEIVETILLPNVEIEYTYGFAINDLNEIGIFGRSVIDNKSHFYILDEEYEIIFTYTSDTNAYFQLRDIIADGNDFVVLGSQAQNIVLNPDDAELIDGILFKANSELGIVWSYDIEEPGYDSMYQIILVDNEYVISGLKKTSSFLLVVSKTGEFVSRNTIENSYYFGAGYFSQNENGYVFGCLSYVNVGSTEYSASFVYMDQEFDYQGIVTIHFTDEDVFCQVNPIIIGDSVYLIYPSDLIGEGHLIRIVKVEGLIN